MSASDGGLNSDSVAMAFQMRAIPKDRLKIRIRSLSAEELAEMELATDEAFGQIEPDPLAFLLVAQRDPPVAAGTSCNNQEESMPPVQPPPASRRLDPTRGVDRNDGSS